ncbi:MAG TPA: histidine kinase [Acidimicrobiales bacterium]|nr:histidine kinase [Acidimicrobiales bacterium]
MSDMELAARLRSLWGTRTERMLTLARLGGLAALIWAVANQLERRIPGEHWSVPVLTVTVVIGWIGWMASRRFGASDQITWGFLALLAASGGVLVAFAPEAIWFVAVAGLGSAIAFEAGPAVAVGGIGLGALVVSVAALGTPSPSELIAEGAFSAAAGLMAGASRRQYLGRTRQAEQLLAERVRADSERDRAAALAERNRVGREIHDVLAHSLGALSVQLDAADALLEGGTDPEKARQLVQQARGLAVQGLEETRQAVHALRDEPVQLTEQLSSLAAREGASLTVQGGQHHLAPDAGLALYRAAQEALTNARKHAPGAPITIHLEFSRAETVLVVANGPRPDGTATTHLKDTGGGFGLQGMRERIELLGGEVQAAPSASGWRVEVAVPA